MRSYLGRQAKLRAPRCAFHTHAQIMKGDKSDWGNAETVTPDTTVRWQPDAISGYNNCIYVALSMFNSGAAKLIYTKLGVQNWVHELLNILYG